MIYERVFIESRKGRLEGGGGAFFLRFAKENAKKRQQKGTKKASKKMQKRCKKGEHIGARNAQLQLKNVAGR